MLTAAVFSVILAAAAALSFRPVDLPSSCAAVLCRVGKVCREAPNKNGDIQARCVALTAPKPGDCPSPDPFDTGFGQCPSNCLLDIDCDGDKKCCKNTCGAFTCQQPRPSCDNVKCEPGQKCEMQDVVCVRAPCDPQPVCVNVKPGECPKSKFNPQGFFACRSQCWSDDDCPGDEKCCMAGCGKRCKDPVPETCATVKCEPGQKCEMQDVVCVRPPCDPQPVCLNVKPGECPKSKFNPQGFFACRSQCWSDDDCPGDEKCCMAGCGKRCKDPVPETCTTVKCEPGQKCEMQDVVCVRPPCDPQPVCLNVKPGECPRFSYVPFGFFVCRSQCWSDDDCCGDQKCCMAGCGKRCKDPVPETCATVDCLPDHKCFMKTKCNKRRCSRKPVCEPVKRCPVYPLWINPNCVPRDDCSVNDPGACPAGTLCCSTDCGRRCVRPLE